MKIRYVENYERIIGDKATALVWQDEIVIDKKYEGTKFGVKILEHEAKHFQYLAPLFERYSEKAYLKTVAMNNIWNFFSTTKLCLLYGDLGDRIIILTSFAIFGLALAFGIGVLIH